MNWFNKWFNKPNKIVSVEEKEEKQELSAKQKATAAGEPYVAIVSIDVDPENLHEGAFELDWNDIFIARLIKAGYQANAKDTDADLVDRWFSNICRHVVLETFEQYEAMQPEYNRVIKRKNLGGGFSEAS